MGAQSALGRRAPTPELLAQVLGHLADRVGTRLRAKQRAGRTVTARVRFAGMRSVTRSITVRDPVSSTLTLTEVATGLVGAAIADHPAEAEISLLGISVSNLVDRAALQLELPLQLAGDADAVRAGSTMGSARWALDQSIDKVRQRFGRDAVGFATVALSAMALVPDEFRELAERDR